MSKDSTYRRLIKSAIWRSVRNEYLSEHPYCEDCLAVGRYIAAQCVHHVVPVETGRSESDMSILCYSPGNLRALCIPCHAAIHKAERSHSRDAVHQRQAERLERWKQAHQHNAVTDQNGRGGG